MEPWILKTLGAASFVVCAAALFAARYRPERITRPLRWCVLAAPIAWSCYAVWEYMMQVAFHGPNIRFDLLVIFPLLGVLSLCQFVAFFVTIDRVLRDDSRIGQKHGHDQHETARPSA